MPRGEFRRVFCVGWFVVKLPRWKNFSQGRRCNRWERESWQVWRPRFGWTSLCPVLIADQCGFIVVMRRAKQPVTEEDLARFHESRPYPDYLVECKEADHGYLDGQVVTLDYAYPDEELVTTQRAYYLGFR